MTTKKTTTKTSTTTKKATPKQVVKKPTIKELEQSVKILEAQVNLLDESLTNARKLNIKLGEDNWDVRGEVMNLKEYVKHLESRTLWSFILSLFSSK